MAQLFGAKYHSVIILFSAILLAVFAGIFGYAPRAGAMAFSLGTHL